MNLTPYKTLIFDCDGVLLDSNHIKTNAFRNPLSYSKSVIALLPI